MQTDKRELVPTPFDASEELFDREHALHCFACGGAVGTVTCTCRSHQLGRKALASLMYWTWQDSRAALNEPLLPGREALEAEIKRIVLAAVRSDDGWAKRVDRTTASLLDLIPAQPRTELGAYHGMLLEILYAFDEERVKQIGVALSTKHAVREIGEMRAKLRSARRANGGEPIPTHAGGEGLAAQLAAADDRATRHLTDANWRPTRAHYEGLRNNVRRAAEALSTPDHDYRAQVGTGSLLRKPTAAAPAGCHCTDICAAPRIMGRQQPCRRPGGTPGQPVPLSPSTDQGARP